MDNCKANIKNRIERTYIYIDNKSYKINIKKKK